MSTSRKRGHLVEYRDGCWRWADTGMPAYDERPCASCGQLAEPDGPDPCLGMLPGIIAACCGHGVAEDAYVLTVDGRRVPGER